jgi:hypothetical protein
MSQPNFTKGTSLSLLAVTTDKGHKLLSPGTITIVGHIPSGTAPSPADVLEFYGVKQEEKRFLTLSKAYKEDRLIFNYSSKDGGGPDPKNRELLGKYFGFLRWEGQQNADETVEPSATPTVVVESKPTFDEAAAQDALGVKPLPKPAPEVSPSIEVETSDKEPLGKIEQTPQPEQVVKASDLSQAITDSLFAGQEWVWPGGSLRVASVDVEKKKVVLSYPFKHGHDIKWIQGDALATPTFVQCLIDKKAEVAPVQ